MISSLVTRSIIILQSFAPMLVALCTQSGCVSSDGAASSGSGAAEEGGSGTSAAAQTYKDLAYADTSSAQKLDLYLPSGAGAPAPLVINIHGGAFKMGDKGSETGNLSALLAEGYAVASLNYRLSGEAKFPAGVQDVKAAVRWLRANASTYGLDPEKFATWGGSAGGYMAAIVGTSGDQKTELDDDSLGNAGVSSAVQAVVDWFGPTDFLAMDSQFEATGACGGSAQQHDPADSPESVWLGGALQTVPEVAKAANPITYVATATRLPPFKIAHGDADCLVPYGQSQLLHDALTEAGVSSELTILEGATHGDAQFGETQTTPDIEFLNETFGR